MTMTSYGFAIRDGFLHLLRHRPEVFTIGQGLWSPWYVGNSMTDLDQEFGRARAIDTPVSELATTGAALRAAVCGYRPIVIHPRMDFMLLAVDQIVTQAAKWRYMFGGDVAVPANRAGHHQPRWGAGRATLAGIAFVVRARTRTAGRDARNARQRARFARGQCALRRPSALHRRPMAVRAPGSRTGDRARPATRAAWRGARWEVRDARRLRSRRPSLCRGGARTSRGLGYLRRYRCTGTEPVRRAAGDRLGAPNRQAPRRLWGLVDMRFRGRGRCEGRGDGAAGALHGPAEAARPPGLVCSDEGPLEKLYYSTVQDVVAAARQLAGARGYTWG